MNFGSKKGVPGKLLSGSYAKVSLDALALSIQRALHNPFDRQLCAFGGTHPTEVNGPA